MLIGTSAVMGQTISPDDAKAKAMTFMKKSSKMKAASANGESMSLAYTAKSGDETYFYVFNNGQDSPVYNLSGMRVNRNTRGLVIVNGKLYLNK